MIVIKWLRVIKTLKNIYERHARGIGLCLIFRLEIEDRNQNAQLNVGYREQPREFRFYQFK